MSAHLTPAYRGVMNGAALVVKYWGRLEVSGLEHVPLDGPVLLAANHDSFWDPLAIGIAARPRRQIHALAKVQLWKNPVVGRVLDGMGQIPIDRGKGDAGALERAIADLRGGAFIGVFPEGTRSRGEQLRPRSGFGRLAQAVPEAEVLCCSVVGTTDIVRFPTHPAVKVRFFRPVGGGLQPGEDLGAFAARLLAEIRREAPIVAAGRRPGLSRRA